LVYWRSGVLVYWCSGILVPSFFLFTNYESRITVSGGLCLILF